MSKLIYVADDEKNIRNLIEGFLLKEGYQVRTFQNGDSLLDTFRRQACDLVILDVMMPGSSGFIICSKLRAVSTVPIMLLTARDTEEDYISGISLGSDDYLTKPFSPVKLVMRNKAIFRRIEMETPSNQERVQFSDLKLDELKLQVFCREQELVLTQTEFNLLGYLLKNPHRAVSREELLLKIWGYDNTVETRATDDTVKRLRKKLSDAQSIAVIETVRGFGFRIAERGVNL